MALIRDTRTCSDSQDALPIGVHAKRVLARLAINTGFLRGIEIDPSIREDLILRSAMEDNFNQIGEEIGLAEEAGR